jgi:L-threonylcarbamoyladenylate synthase
MILPFRTSADVAAALEPVRAHLAAGRLLGYPTETVYGLGSAPDAAALAALAALKGRPSKKPFLLLVSSRAMAAAWGLVFNTAARALADAFWPGPLTLVLPGGEGRLPDSLVSLFADAMARGELLVLDGGVLGNVPPSTIVDCTGVMPRMVREGALPRAELRRAVGRLAP